jgi:transmembrane sensor
MKRQRRERIVPVPEQAAEWLVELAGNGTGHDVHRRFMSWLKKSPQHVEEFLAIAGLQQEIAERSSTVEEILSELKSRDTDSAVPLFAGSETAGKAMRQAVPRRRRYLLWASAAAAALAAFLMARSPVVESPVIGHRTDLGEQRSVALGDGSIVTLNTLSEVAVRFDRSSRTVTLLSGEALFDVASDAERPFVVETGTLSLRAVGTKFSVYRKKASTRVAVVDGVVSAVSSRAPDRPLIVQAGEGAIATLEGLVPTGDRFDVQKAIAWTERRLVFDGAPLAEVVAEFNRYNRTPLIVEDSGLANRAVTTVFNANDVSALLAFLELEPDVDVQRGDDAIRIRVKR